MDALRLRDLRAAELPARDLDQHELRIGMFLLPSRLPRVDDLTRVLGHHCGRHFPLWVSLLPLQLLVIRGLTYIAPVCGMCAGTSTGKHGQAMPSHGFCSAHRHYKGPTSNLEDRLASRDDEKVEVA